MFLLNCKIAFRNLLKNKAYAGINIAGLAMGLTSFILLLLFVNHESSYDEWHPDLKRVYQLREYHDFSTPDNRPYWQVMNESRVGNLVREKIPQFKYVTKVDPDWDYGVTLKVEGTAPLVVKNIRDVDSLFFKVFPYTFLEGEAETAIRHPGTIVLKESAAQKLFGTTKVIGKKVKVIVWKNDPGQTFTVTGVVAEPTGPSSLPFSALTHSGEQEEDPDNLRTSHFCEVYGITHGTLDLDLLNQNLQKIYIDYKKSVFMQLNHSLDDFNKEGKQRGLKALAMKDVHAQPVFTTPWKNKAGPVMVLSVFLLLISIINFINLSTVQSVQRAKEVGVKKVLGVNHGQLVKQFLTEAAMQCLIALFLSIMLAELLSPLFNAYFEVPLSFWGSPALGRLFFQLAMVFLLVTLLVGFYPALVLSRFHPIKVLKGNYERSFRGMALRNALVVLQFVIGVGFMISIGIMYQQVAYLSQKNLGFEKGKLMNILTNYSTEDGFLEAIKRIPEVKYVGSTTQVMGNSFHVPQMISYRGTKHRINTVTLTMDAFPALGVQIKEGRLFSNAYGQDTINSVVLNESANQLLGGKMLGETYQFEYPGGRHEFKVVGIIKDYHNEGFDKAILPTIYKVSQLGGTSSTNNFLVRIESDHPSKVIDQIETTWNRFFPEFPMQYTTGEQALEVLLKNDKRLMRMILLFSIITICLSLLGLFALSAFMAKRRTKELAIRRVLGASSFQLIKMLNQSFLWLVVVANLISWPLVYWWSSEWLSHFAYRIDVPLWPFLIAGLTSLVVALLTITIQSGRAVAASPVKALKYE